MRLRGRELGFFLDFARGSPTIAASVVRPQPCGRRRSAGRTSAHLASVD